MSGYCIATHFGPNEGKISFTISSGRHTELDQYLGDLLFFETSEARVVMGLGRHFELKVTLVLNFAKDLHQFLQTASDIVGIRKFRELPRDTFCLQEA